MGIYSQRPDSYKPIPQPSVRHFTPQSVRSLQSVMPPPFEFTPRPIVPYFTVRQMNRTLYSARHQSVDGTQSFGFGASAHQSVVNLMKKLGLPSPHYNAKLLRLDDDSD